MTFLKRTKQEKENGFTLIEALVMLFLFVVITVTFYSVWSVGTRYILLSKNRLTALALANEKMEVIRNLAFEKVALTTSVPAGNIQENEDVARAGKSYHVFTQIKKEDDPYDGTLGGSTNDVAFVDYKDVKITISWDGDQQNISLASRFVPAGIEQSDSTLGVLVVNVYSDQPGGAGIPGSNVRIVNSNIGFDETHNTDSFGRLVLNGLPGAIKQYKITLTKEGYETVNTMDPYPSTPYNPVDVHASVVAGAVNAVNIVQDELANFKIESKNYLGDPVGNVTYHLEGGRRLGTSGTDPVFNMDVDDETDAQGEKDYGGISPGQYDFALTSSGYSVIGISHGLRFSLPSGEETTLSVKVSPDNVTALSVTVRKNDDLSVISGASVHLTNTSGYDATVITGSDGIAFFPVAAEPPFVAGDYAVSVTASDFENYSGSVTVDNSQLKKQDILMSHL